MSRKPVAVGAKAPEPEGSGGPTPEAVDGRLDKTLIGVLILIFLVAFLGMLVTSNFYGRLKKLEALHPEIQNTETKGSE